MDDDTKKILEDIKQSVAGLARAANEISEYLTWLRKQREMPQLRETPPVDTRQPYLAGRQPRRDGNNMVNQPSPTGGAHGTQAKADRK